VGVGVGVGVRVGARGSFFARRHFGSRSLCVLHS
jgi:hypothetical protein